ncbi:endospore coat-associated protein [Paenibacillus darwinianus]|uniref:Endospore coat-associated protein n=1 Tax=Paenibacillus darwinianus TaxID=1380763 RepID=A0A9W5S3H6_9BACL|nr:YheC/YheD family protein [Paenibacillus darwinianus]EXX91590.1 endospore coat-associated protein [Paenibacillus darwinianus]EXX91734.1 endospore coat-associated protein [Paenibacillus darwinianus]EXX92451.1 endospore coat-associated protein [Paenibacillus darwinianus]
MAAIKTLTLTVGVLSMVRDSTERMPEDRYCRSLAELGSEQHLDLIVFAPADIDEVQRTVMGYRLRRGVWQQTEAPVPPLYYDRLFCRTRDERLAGRTAADSLERCGSMPLGGGLPDKRTVYRALARDAGFAPLLPPTVPFRPAELKRLLGTYPQGLFLKPAGGMQGRGTVAVRFASSPGRSSEERAAFGQDGPFAVQGRSSGNRPFTRRFPDAGSLGAWLTKVTGSSRYVAQPLLKLNSPDGAPFDVRVLVQKDGAGYWRISGTGVRIGAPGTATSNLHGGGAARLTAPFLAAAYGESAAGRLMGRLQEAALQAAGLLEQSFGRLAELGLDFGIEPDGRLWFIEANGKPGRTLFRLSGDAEALRLAVLQPLAYARFLLDRNACSARTGSLSLDPAGAIETTVHTRILQEVHP